MVQTFYLKECWNCAQFLEDVKELGLYTIAKHPWHHPNLAKMAKELGFKVREEEFLLRRTPDWAKARGYWGAASPAQKRVWRSMKAVGETAHILGVRVSGLLKKYGLPLPEKKGKERVREEVLARRREARKAMWAAIEAELGPEVVARILEEVRKYFETNRAGIEEFMARYGGKKEKYGEALSALAAAIAAVRR